MTSEIINDGGSSVEELTIPARAEYNGTRVQCLVLSLSDPDLSGNATMIIQGIVVDYCWVGYMTALSRSTIISK